MNEWMNECINHNMLCINWKSQVGFEISDNYLIISFEIEQLVEVTILQAVMYTVKVVISQK